MLDTIVAYFRGHRENTGRVCLRTLWPSSQQRQRQHYYQRVAAPASPLLALFPLLLFICTYSPMYCARLHTRICICIYTLARTHTHTHSWVMCAKVAAALFDARIVVLPFDFCRQFTHILFISILLLSPRLCRPCCRCLGARICFAAKWHRALGKCVKIQSVAGALEAWNSSARHRGQVCVWCSVRVCVRVDFK